MSHCNCSRCSRRDDRSTNKCSSRRDDRSSHKCRTSPKRKYSSCNCNKCRHRTSPKCKCHEECDDDVDKQTNGNNQSHHFIITVKTSN